MGSAASKICAAVFYGELLTQVGWWFSITPYWQRQMRIAEVTCKRPAPLPIPKPAKPKKRTTKKRKPKPFNTPKPDNLS
ncbi:hypothetical protein NIG5292_02356 [Nereida ignava]|uniref:Uncharacterized protein n=1 Tax=Nereida ignava TaxID=282199 RepID=A0A0U1NP84_9RHOB|nr:hypothetical protein NIG5292_02356 [Nereida ignava]SFJ81495.1 hypothetical protein SAMN02745667_02454 [Nereida ignava DSM 16309]